MAYTPSNKCAKNCRKRTILVQVIAEDVVFFGTVYNVEIWLFTNCAYFYRGAG